MGNFFKSNVWLGGERRFLDGAEEPDVDESYSLEDLLN